MTSVFSFATNLVTDTKSVLLYVNFFSSVIKGGKTLPYFRGMLKLSFITIEHFGFLHFVSGG